MAVPNRILEFERWLGASTAEAGRLVPDLVALPSPLMLAELRRRPELRTAGVLRGLLAVAREAVHRFPSRACEITAIVARHARTMEAPPGFAFAARVIQGEAWRDHARALRETGRTARAVKAARVARTLLRNTPGSPWLEATVDLVEAPLLHDDGLHAEALRMIRRAAETFHRSRDYSGCVEARMLESWMLWTGGERAAAAEVWETAVKAALREDDVELMARLASKMGVLELRHGSAEEASRLLTAAVDLFAAMPASEDAVRARWHLAEALAERGRVHDAISEYHKVRAQLMARGLLADAAIAAVEILDLHLVAGRVDELPSLTQRFVHLFRDAGLLINSMEALAYLRGRANAGELTHDHLAYVRAFFEDLVHQPYARFNAP